MDIISYNEAATANGRIEKFNANPDSNSGVLKQPKVIEAGEIALIKSGRQAILADTLIEGDLVIEVDADVLMLAGTISGSDSASVKLSGDQIIDDVKTFTSSPIVPTPTTDFQVANKKYVDDYLTDIKTIATGTATFTATTNKINLTGIGVGVEIGDVIQISGATDSKNNSEFTVEVITDANNIIVNQVHANKGTSKNVVARVGDSGVTVKLLAKWYNAPLGLGQKMVNFPLAVNTTRKNLTGRPILLTMFVGSGNGIIKFENITTGEFTYITVGNNVIASGTLLIGVNEIYKWTVDNGSPGTPTINEVR